MVSLISHALCGCNYTCNHTYLHMIAGILVCEVVNLYETYLHTHFGSCRRISDCRSGKKEWLWPWNENIQVLVQPCLGEREDDCVFMTNANLAFSKWMITGDRALVSEWFLLSRSLSRHTFRADYESHKNIGHWHAFRFQLVAVSFGYCWSSRRSIFFYICFALQSQTWSRLCGIFGGSPKSWFTSLMFRYSQLCANPWHLMHRNVSVVQRHPECLTSWGESSPVDQQLRRAAVHKYDWPSHVPCLGR